MDKDFSKIKEESYKACMELIEIAKPEAGDVLVVGCSTSEVAGQKIGTSSVPELANEIFAGIYEAASANGLFVAAQCCEHLNRALIIEKKLAKLRNYEIVNVVPWPKAGGSFATAAYSKFNEPVAVEHIKAELGMDLGDTLIGMHLKDVAVPVRLSAKKIGEAHLVCARTRAKFIGGERAHYDMSAEV